MTALRWAEGRHFSPAAMWLLGVGVLCGFILGDHKDSYISGNKHFRYKKPSAYDM